VHRGVQHDRVGVLLGESVDRGLSAVMVIVVGPDLAGLAGRQAGVAASAGLDGGLLVGGDHIIVAAQRCTVAGAVVQVEHALRLTAQSGSVMARSTRSGHDHRDSRTPLSRGGVQAIALARVTWTAVNFCRRPDHFASASDAAPDAAHQRRRHLRTVSSQTGSA
jgi:hypothetical protein